MAGGRGNIDAISVSLGVDLKQLKTDLRSAKGELDKALPAKKEVFVQVRINTPNNAISDMYQDIRTQFEGFQKGAGANALRIAPKLVIHPRTMTDFRKDIERNMMQAGRSGHGIHVPIKFNGDIKAFVASIGHIEVPVYGRWAGWSAGGGPPEGAGGGGGGGGGSTGPRGVPGRGPGTRPPGRGTAGPAGGGPAPTPARGRPAAERARGATGGTVVPPHVYARPGTETRSSDVYESEPPPPTPRQQRQTQRRAAMSGATPPPARRPGLSVPGRGMPTRPSDRPYEAPAGGRVDMASVRGGSAEVELQGEERAAYIAQQGETRSRRNFAPNTAPQVRSGGRPTTPKAIERLERRRRYQASVQRGMSPQDAAAREHVRSGFHTLDPDLAAAYDIINDPESTMSFDQFLESAERTREAYGTAFHGGLQATPKGIRRTGAAKRVAKQRRVAKGFGKGDLNAVPPEILLFDAALGAARDLQLRMTDPNYAIQVGDQKGRGRGGKVGKAGGRSAGRVASETIDPSRVSEILARRAVGGPGNGWESLKKEGYSAAEISVARSRIGANNPKVVSNKDPRAPGLANVQLDEETLEGGVRTRHFTHIGPEAPALTAAGGQGMFRSEPTPDRPQPRDLDRPGIDPASLIGVGGARDTSRYAGRKGKGPFQKWMDRQRDLQLARNRPVGPYRFAEGGLIDYLADGGKRPKYGKFVGMEFPKVGAIPGSVLRQAFGQAVPRKGSKERVEMDERFRTGLRNRTEREKKPAHQQGGKSGGPEWQRNRALLIERERASGLRCAYCGQPTIEGDNGPRGTTVDHIEDVGSTGVPNHSLENLQIMDNQHNGLKAGGKSARKLAEGGLAPGLQAAADRNLAALSGKYGIPAKAKAGGRGEMVYASLARNVVIGRDSKPGEKGEWPYTFAHEYGHLVDDSIPFRQRNKFMRGALGRKAHAEEFADMFAQAERSGEDPHGIGEFVKGAGRVRGGILGRTANRMGQDLSFKFGRRAEGGAVKHGGLLARMAQAGHQPSVTMVGERGPELLVSDPGNGETEVVPAHKVPTWLQRAKEGQGLAKDMTHRADGGRWTMRGSAGPRAATAQRMASGILAGGDITRVFVVNWPATLTTPPPGTTTPPPPPNPAQGNPAQPNAAAPNAQANQQGNQQGGAFAMPPGAPGQGGGGGGGGRINPAARAEARREVRGDVRLMGFEERIGNVRAGIQGSLQEAPVRALSVAFGQIAQQMIGGRSGILKRARTATAAAGEAQEEFGYLQQIRQQESEARFKERARSQGISGETPAQMAKNRAEEQRMAPLLAQAATTQEAVVEQATGAAETAEKGVLSRGQQFRAQAVGLGGIIGGTAVFTAAMTAFSVASTAAASALDPLVQTMLGWPATIEKVTASLRDAVMAANGNVGAGIAAAVVPSGVSAAYLDARGGALAATARNRAASTAGQQALEISRAASAGPQGLYGAVGGFMGTGIGTEQFGGQSGYLESVTARLKRPGLERVENPLNNIDKGEVSLGLVKVGAQFAEAIPSIIGDIAGALNPNDPHFLKPGAGFDEQRARSQAEQDKEVTDLNKGLEKAAKHAGNVADAFQLVTNASDEQKKAMIESASAISTEARRRAEEMAAVGVAVVGPGGRNLQGKDYGQYGEQQAASQLIQDPALLLRASAPQRRARAFQIGAQAQFQRGEDLPAQFAMQMRAQPLGRIGAGYDQSSLSGQARRDQAESLKATKSIDDETAKGTAALENIVSRIDRPSFQGGVGVGFDGPKGGETLRQNAPGPALTAFRGIMGRVGGIGQQITQKQDTVAQAQATLQAHEYAEQLRLANQSLGDAKDLWAGINGANKNTLGGLQGQNILLDRQNQLLGRRQQRLSFKSEDIGFKQSDLQIKAQNLGFQQTQRQINFQTAVAGFAAPGSTPEERAARINEAKLEAEFAQKQLDLQIQIAEQGREQLKIAREQSKIGRQQFGNQVQQQENQFAITAEEAKRSVDTIQASLNLLMEGHTVTIDTAAAEEAIGRLQKQQGILIEQAQSYVTEGQTVRDAVLADISNLMTETEEGFATLVGETESAWNEAFKRSYNNYLKPLTTYLNNLGSGGGTGGWSSQGGDHPGGGGHADGIIGSTSGPTQFMAGEAGREHVIVLRNATTGTMQMGLGGGGGGGGINVGGVTIVVSGTKNMDEAKLAEMVVERMSRKLSMLGAA